jgi:hypothetical protein
MMKSNIIGKINAFIVTTILVSSINSLANEAPSKRKTVINFDEEVVEGINRKPLDSVNQLSESEARRRLHLYRKRAGFSDLNDELAQDVRIK